MAQERYTNLSLAGALVLFSVYVLNLAYKKSIQEITFISDLQESVGTGFQGLDGTMQFLLLLLMATLFTITIVLRRGAGSA